MAQKKAFAAILEHCCLKEDFTRWSKNVCFACILSGSSCWFCKVHGKTCSKHVVYKCTNPFIAVSVPQTCKAPPPIPVICFRQGIHSFIAFASFSCPDTRPWTPWSSATLGQSQKWCWPRGFRRRRERRGIRRKQFTNRTHTFACRSVRTRRSGVVVVVVVVVLLSCFCLAVSEWMSCSTRQKTKSLCWRFSCWEDCERACGRWVALCGGSYCQPFSRHQENRGNSNTHGHVLDMAMVG